MNWREAVRTLSQRRVEEAMGEALDCLQYAGGCTLERVLEVYFLRTFLSFCPLLTSGLASFGN